MLKRVERETEMHGALGHAAREAARNDWRRDEDDGLLATAVPIMVGAFLMALGVVTMTFWSSGETLLSLAVCLVYGVMFFSVPVAMAKVRNKHDARWLADGPKSTSDIVEICTGTLRRHEALVQMVLVPVCVAFAFTGFAIIWVLVRP
jgi:hypothetical protein